MTGQGGATLQPLTGTLAVPPATGKGSATKVSSGNSPMRRGSLSLFFRKVSPPLPLNLLAQLHRPDTQPNPSLPAPLQVYHLASVRLRHLCAKLDISSELRRKIWTCFEYSLVHCSHMMMDRHLDQLLMCAVYVMAKVC